MPAKKLDYPLQAIRKRRKMSALQIQRASEKLCAIMGSDKYFLSKERIRQLESTDSLPTPKRAAALAFILGIEVTRLWDIKLPPHKAVLVETTNTEVAGITAKTDLPTLLSEEPETKEGE